MRNLVLECERCIVRFNLNRCLEAAAPERLDAVLRGKEGIWSAFVDISITGPDVVVSDAGSGSVDGEHRRDVHVMAAVNKRR